jgi:hypothetical protein
MRNVLAVTMCKILGLHPKLGRPREGVWQKAHLLFYEAELREINNILTRGPCYDRRAALICLYSTAVIAEEQQPEYSSHDIKRTADTA